jgi:hypothetical protein
MTFTKTNIALSFGGKCKECLNVNQEELDTTIDAIMLTTETAFGFTAGILKGALAEGRKKK